MTERLDQGANQRRFPGAEVAFEKNHHPRPQCRRQDLAQALRGRLVGQGKNGGNIGTMHDPNSTLDEAALKEAICQAGRELGFAAVGFARADTTGAAAHLRDWLAAGCHGEMDYMARHAELRADPQLLLAGTVTVISAAVDYLPHGKITNDPGQAAISRYAQGRDYHKVVRHRLQRLAETIGALASPFGYRVFSDSAPVMEVHFAQQAGLGWRGKHTLLLSQQGSWRFLGEIYCDLPLPPDTPVEEHCGTCTACLDTCPTQAITAPYRVDARRCISYLTIELAGAIPKELRPLLGNRIYGCDDCQLVCPWNKFAQRSTLPDFDVREGLDDTTLLALWAWREPDFLQRSAGSPIRRIGWTRWRRNLAVAMGNAWRATGDRAMAAALCRDRDGADELVREHIDWALAQRADQP